MKRMRHPLHGWHHAYNLTEEAVMRKNGWVDDEPEPVAEPAPAEAPEVQEPERVKRKYTRKP
jgi:hypothetical protein